MLAKQEGKLLVVKRLSDTRWSARHDAVRALTSGYKEQIEILEEIAASEESRAEVKIRRNSGWSTGSASWKRRFCSKCGIKF